MKLVSKHLNDNIFSSTLFVSFVTLIVGNIMMITSLIYGNLNWSQRIVFTYLILNHSSVSLIFYLVFISWSNSLKMASPVLFQAQMKLGIWKIGTKIILMRHFELLNANPFKFSIGSLGKISTFAFLKVFLYLFK